MKVLIFGLPGAGKTYLANEIIDKIGHGRCVHINADEIRKEADDWDFSEQGRWRQFRRMLNKANAVSESGKIALVDFVCPFASAREQFDADLTIFMGTIQKGRFEDTNQVFEWPTEFEADLTYWEWDEENTYEAIWRISEEIWNDQAPTVQMLGRWQPWHDGHQALLTRALDKTGQVNIQIRDMEYSEQNPYCAFEVKENLERKLCRFAGQIKISIVPNITNITYGRKVGYTIEQEVFSKEIEGISGTNIRKGLQRQSLIDSK